MCCFSAHCFSFNYCSIYIYLLLHYCSLCLFCYSFVTRICLFIIFALKFTNYGEKSKRACKD